MRQSIAHVFIRRFRVENIESKNKPVFRLVSTSDIKSSVQYTYGGPDDTGRVMSKVVLIDGSTQYVKPAENGLYLIISKSKASEYINLPVGAL